MTDMEKELKRTEASRGDWTGVRISMNLLNETDIHQNAALETQGEAAIKKLKVSSRGGAGLNVRPTSLSCMLRYIHTTLKYSTLL